MFSPSNALKALLPFWKKGIPNLTNKNGCEFVALAQDLNVPLITTDNQILNSFPELTVSLKSFTQ
jgi:hypothetical protein